MANALIISGKDIADKIMQQQAQEISTFPSAPALAVFLVGNNPASMIYVRNKIKKAEMVGIKAQLFALPATVSEQDLLTQVFKVSQNPAYHGVLVQLPLPSHIDEHHIIAAISPLKDVDGFTPENIGMLALGEDCLAPCTPLGCIKLIKTVMPDMTGKDALVIGRSNIVGRPLAQMLQNENCTVTIAHSKTVNLPAKARQADILVAACGCPSLVKGDWIKAGAIVIDVGISYLPDGTIKGDVDFAQAVNIAGAITPVPKGVGPMTIAMLFANTIKAYKIQQNLALMRQGQSYAEDEDSEDFDDDDDNDSNDDYDEAENNT